MSLYLIIDFFEKIRMFLSNHASIVQMASYFFVSIPMIISLILPAVILLTTLMAYGNLSKFNEITAMKANGISLYRIALPAIIFAAVASVFLFYFSEMITPAAIQKADHIIFADVQKQKNLGYFKQNEIWYHGDYAIYNFKIFDVSKNTLRGVTINFVNPDLTLKSRIDAESAEWKNDKWTFYNLLLTTFDQNGTPILEWAKQRVISLSEKPSDFKIMQKDAEKMGYFDLRRYVKKLQSEGYDSTRYLVDLYGKIAFPFVTVILVFIGIPFSLRSERKGGIMQSIGIGIFIGFSYFIVNAFCLSLGRSGTLPPILAAWSANTLFSAAAAVLFYRVRS
jgi:lipopolysaccharide export system permease protein